MKSIILTNNRTKYFCDRGSILRNFEEEIQLNIINQLIFFIGQIADSVAPTP